MQKIKAYTREELCRTTAILNTDESLFNAKAGSSRKYTIAEFVQALSDGTWRGGYVIGMGYISANSFTRGSSDDDNVEVFVPYDPFGSSSFSEHVPGSDEFGSESSIILNPITIDFKYVNISYSNCYINIKYSTSFVNNSFVFTGRTEKISGNPLAKDIFFILVFNGGGHSNEEINAGYLPKGARAKAGYYTFGSSVPELSGGLQNVKLIITDNESYSEEILLYSRI